MAHFKHPHFEMYDYSYVATLYTGVQEAPSMQTAPRTRDKYEDSVEQKQCLNAKFGSKLH